jgi:hypothetical protein
MSVTRCGWLAMLLLGAAAFGLAQDQPVPQMPNTYAQIVRVSFVEGDVRVLRGKDAEKQTKEEWEKAVVDLPIDPGYSLVTGAGRAEIEFEDASVVYLAENSVLVFNELSSTGGVPRTELALLSGTLTMNVKPMAAGEWFTVRTPTERFATRYPDNPFVRVNSYLDAMKVTAMGTTVFRVDRASAIQTNGGQTITYRNGQRTLGQKGADEEFADFDQWVLHRVMTRNAAMLATMKEAGLTAPVPGLAELQGQGRFFDCAPYGTCWEPTNGWAGPVTTADKAAMAQSTVSVAQLKQGGSGAAGTQTTGGQRPRLEETIDYFPCSPLRMRNLYEVDPVTGKRKLVFSQALPVGVGFRYAGAQPYQWAVCHTGSWIHREGRYAWVPGRKRHHHYPVHWVKDGHKAGYVPIHPKDVTGKPPVGLKDGIIHPVEKNGSKVEVLTAANAGTVKLLDWAPKEFREEPFVPLERAEAPKAKAYSMAAATVAATGMKPLGTEVMFDHKTQSFMVAREPGAAWSGNSKMMEPIGGRASGLQAQSTFAGGGAARSGMSSSSGAAGGGSRGSSGSSSSYSGGGGGASHASAPAASAPSSSSSMSSSSASSGASSAASSGGGKH